MRPNHFDHPFGICCSKTEFVLYLRSMQSYKLYFMYVKTIFMSGFISSPGVSVTLHLYMCSVTFSLQNVFSTNLHKSGRL